MILEDLAIETFMFCILIIANGEYDCEWEYYLWYSYNDLIEYKLETDPTFDLEDLEDLKARNKTLGGWYDPLLKRVHIYLWDDRNGIDEYGYLTSTAHEIYGHAFKYVQWIYSIQNLDLRVDIRCPCNFH